MGSEPIFGAATRPREQTVRGRDSGPDAPFQARKGDGSPLALRNADRKLSRNGINLCCL